MTALHHRVGLDNSESKIKTKVYDVVNKKLIAEFESRKVASDFTGVPPEYITRIVKTKYKCYKNKLNTTITFR